MLDKSEFNFIIDALMFLCMAAIAGLGFLMKFILIPGGERWATYGRNVELLLLGMDRHEWGKIHLIIGFVLLGLLTLHIILHWKLIVGLFQKIAGNQKARQMIAPSFVGVSLLMLIAPFAVRPEVQELGKGEGCGGCMQSIACDSGHAADGLIEIKGFMTLAEVSKKYNVPTHCLKTHLEILESVSDEQELGELGETFGFKMSEVEKVIAEYRGVR